MDGIVHGLMARAARDPSIYEANLWFGLTQVKSIISTPRRQALDRVACRTTLHSWPEDRANAV
jgi:hypothetical protein